MFEIPEKRIFEYPKKWRACAWPSRRSIRRTERISETADAITEYFFTDVYIGGIYHWSQKHARRQKKSLCVGGPMDGQKSTEALAGEYHVFNNAGGAPESTILVHDSIFVDPK